MRRRCRDPKRPQYHRYGARGITVCEEWDRSFPEFLAYVSKLPGYGGRGMTLDRRDGNGNYEPGNVQWACRTEQMRNQCRNIRVEIDGSVFTSLTAACERYGVPFTVAHQRLYALKWTIQKTLSTPLRKDRRRKAAEVEGITYQLQSA